MKRERTRKKPRGRPFGKGPDHPSYRLAERVAKLRVLQAAYEPKISALPDSATSKPPAINSRDPETLIRDAQQELHRHHFGEFYEPGIPQPITGSVSCRRVIPSYPHFVKHLIADVTPAALRKATNPAD
jgi:hypothetical protein